MEKEQLLSRKNQQEMLDLARENYYHDLVSAEAAYRVTHKEIIMLIIKDEVESLIDPDRPNDTTAIQGKLDKLSVQKETIDSIKRQLAALSQLTDKPKKVEEAVKLFVGSLPLSNGNAES